jgi:hypothetical protein
MFIPRLSDWIEIGKGLLKTLQGKGDEGYIPPTPQGSPPPQPVDPDQARPRADSNLSEHFGLFELTKTNNAALQAKNRILTDAQVGKLTELAALMEQVRSTMGCAIDVHSGYRCPELNAATTKAAKKSQHMLCEACDWGPVGPEDEAAVEAAFQKVLAAAKAGDIKFGQLIVEKAQRGFSKSVWVHISMGLPYRDPARCGEVMRMTEQNGEQVYTLIEKVPQEAA